MEKKRFKSRVYTNMLNEERCHSVDRLQQHWLDRMDCAAVRFDKQNQQLGETNFHEQMPHAATLSPERENQTSPRSVLSVHCKPAADSGNTGTEARSRIRTGTRAQTTEAIVELQKLVDEKLLAPHAFGRAWNVLGLP